MNKEKQYAMQIISHMAKMFEDDCENQIDKEELMQGDNLTHFLHALSNLVPNHFYNTITGDEKNNLEFNHLANHLVFQYSKATD